MPTVCIIGAGELGGAVAHALARGAHVARVVLVDDAAGVAAGKALDIQQAGAIERFHTRLEGTDDPSRATGVAACVIADRSGRSSVEWQGEEGLALLTRLPASFGASPIVFAGARQAALIHVAAKEARIARERLLGSAPEAFAAAVTSMVAVEARCSPSEIGLTVLGAPDDFVVPWSDASIGGYSLERILTPAQLSRIDARVARLWPPGPHALGRAAARVVEALVSSSRRTFSVLTVLDGEFGVRDGVGVLPSMLSRQGIVATRVPPLNTRERVRLLGRAPV